MATATEAPKKASGARKTRATATPKNSTAKREMSDEHKASLAEGREQARIIAKYLEALDQNRPKRGRKVSRESREKRLGEIDTELAGASAMGRLLLMAERARLVEFLEQEEGNGEVDFPALEADFVKHAKSFALRRGIPRSVWRNVGVPSAVLNKAGIKRSTV